MFLLLICLASAVTYEEKEEKCYLLTERFLYEKKREMMRQIQKYKDLNMVELRDKVAEDGFHYCVDN